MRAVYSPEPGVRTSAVVGRIPVRLVEKDGAVRFEVHAKPRAKKSAVLGPRGDAVEVSLAAPPVEGAANDELLRVLAKALGVARRQLALVRGETSRTKLVEVTGLPAEEVRRCLSGVRGVRGVPE